MLQPSFHLCFRILIQTAHHVKENKAYQDYQAPKADLVKEDLKGTQEEEADLDIQGSKGYQDHKG